MCSPSSHLVPAHSHRRSHSPGSGLKTAGEESDASEAAQSPSPQERSELGVPFLCAVQCHPPCFEALTPKLSITFCHALRQLLSLVPRQLLNRSVAEDIQGHRQKGIGFLNTHQVCNLITLLPCE